MHIWVLHNQIGADATEDERDVLVQVAEVTSALTELGHTLEIVECTLDLENLFERVIRERPDVIFNLVEALGGTDRLAHFVPALLDTLQVPFTGCRATSLTLANDKLLAKRIMRHNELPTPAWWTTFRAARDGVFEPGRYIIKAVHEHASFGIDDDVVVELGNADEALRLLTVTEKRWQRPCFAERFINGREFNLSLLATGEGVQVLPPAEIDFGQFPEGKPRIVGYKAKWAADSFEFVGTPRTFDFAGEDSVLLDQLRELARQCWAVFDLTGYARVDFRVDAESRPYILEINGNPCLSPDAGFAAALTQAKITFSDAVQKMITTALSY